MLETYEGDRWIHWLLWLIPMALALLALVMDLKIGAVILLVMTAISDFHRRSRIQDFRDRLAELEEQIAREARQREEGRG